MDAVAVAWMQAELKVAAPATAFEAAIHVQLAKIARAHTWECALRASTPGDPERERFRDAPAETLAALFDAPWARPL